MKPEQHRAVGPGRPEHELVQALGNALTKVLALNPGEQAEF
jgi:hypothetical protein